MKKIAIGLINGCIGSSPLRAWMHERCAAAGIEIRWVMVTAGHSRHYKPLFMEHANVLTWSYRMPHAWMSARGKNVLYMQTSLIHQPAGAFLDHGGFFADSNLCRKQTWRETHEVDVFATAKRWFGWDFCAGGTNDGPLLVALQKRMDAPMRYYFPLAATEADKVVRTLKLLREHLPFGRDVLIRPHPGERKLFTTNFNAATGGQWRKEWKPDMSGSLAERLPQCSALITVNSTCASEAALLGIPTATLGRGAFTGSGVTLECADNPALLADTLSWKPDMDRNAAYVRAVIGRHFLPYDAQGAKSAEFTAWLESAHSG